MHIHEKKKIDNELKWTNKNTSQTSFLVVPNTICKTNENVLLRGDYRRHYLYTA